MINDPVLVNDWHPVATLEQLAEKSILRVRLLREELVLWQVGDEVQVFSTSQSAPGVGQWSQAAAGG